LWGCHYRGDLVLAPEAEVEFLAAATPCGVVV
jgi:hypothetical protein